MAEDRHRPAIGWARPRRNEKIEKDIFGALGGNRLPRWRLGNEYPGILPVLSGKFPKRHLADGAGEYLQCTQQRIQTVRNERTNRQRLHIPSESCDGIQRKYRLLSTAAQVEVHSRRCSGLNLLANAAQRSCCAFSGKEAGSSYVASGNPKPLEYIFVQSALEGLLIPLQQPVSIL